MKPETLRRRRKAAEDAEQDRVAALDAHLRGDGPLNVVRPELIPTAMDRVLALREYRKQVRLAAGEPQGSLKRDLLLDRALAALAAVVYVDRVLLLDRLERAALTPAQLRVLNLVGPNDLADKMMELQRGGGR